MEERDGWDGLYKAKVEYFCGGSRWTEKREVGMELQG